MQTITFSQSILFIFSITLTVSNAFVSFSPCKSLHKLYESKKNFILLDSTNSFNTDALIKVSKTIVISSIGLFLQFPDSLPSYFPFVAVPANAQYSTTDYVQNIHSSTLFISEGSLLSKSTAVLNVASTKKATDKPAATVVGEPKSVEDIALEGAIQKKNAGKQRLETLYGEIKSTQAKVSSLKSEIKTLQSSIKSIDDKLKKVDELKGISTSSEFDVSQKKIKKELEDNKAAAAKKINEVIKPYHPFRVTTTYYYCPHTLLVLLLLHLKQQQLQQQRILLCPE